MTSGSQSVFTTTVLLSPLLCPDSLASSFLIANNLPDANRSSILNLPPIIEKNLSNVDQAADLDRVGDRAPRALQGRDHGEGQVPVQATVDGQQRRDLHPRSQRRRLAKVQDDHRPLQIRARTGSPYLSLD